MEAIRRTPKDRTTPWKNTPTPRPHLTKSAVKTRPSPAIVVTPYTALGACGMPVHQRQRGPMTINTLLILLNCGTLVYAAPHVVCLGILHPDGTTASDTTGTRPLDSVL